MTEFSRHVNEQHAWTEHLLSRLRDNISSAKSFKSTHVAYLEARAAIYDSEKRLTRENLAYVHGYMAALDSLLIRDRIHVRRITGRPETASAAKWDDMTEELRQACRERRTEACLAWDEKGLHLFSEWTVG